MLHQDTPTNPPPPPPPSVQCIVFSSHLKLVIKCISFYFSSIYRYVLEPEVTFQSDSSYSPGPMARFLDMPQTPLFTLNINTPESWMVESVHTRYDLDNIYLEEVGSKHLDLFLYLSKSFHWIYF